MSDVVIFTDGACSGNPGKGGCGAVIIKVKENTTSTISKGFKLTTNNRMELMALNTSRQCRHGQKVKPNTLMGSSGKKPLCEGPQPSIFGDFGDIATLGACWHF